MSTTTLVGYEPIVLEHAYPAPKDKVWKALTEQGQMKVWYFPQLEAFRPEVGFETLFSAFHNGKDFLHLWRVTEVIPGQKISYEWKYWGYPGTSLLTIELFEQMRTTWLRLTHAGVESFRGDLFPDLARENFIKGWTGFIGTSLREYVRR